MKLRKENHVMGRFFTSTQILNEEKLNKDAFLKKYCEKMKKEGYVQCETDEGEISYSFAFSDNADCKWVTMSSESYGEGNSKAESDTARIAKMLGTTCINTVVIDSDCAILNLYDKKGNKVDMLVMGRADDYLGKYISDPERKVWESLIGEEYKWEEFIEVIKKDYIFIEEGLTCLSETIGTSESLFDEVSLSDNLLAFKKEAQKEKKLTANAAFKQIFGELLEPMGFIFAKKTKTPCFLRAVGNGDVVHVIKFLDNNGRLALRSGILTVYRQSIDLNDKTYDNNWLPMIRKYYFYYNEYICGNDYHSYNIQIEYHKNNTESIVWAVKKLLDETKKWVIPVLEKVNSLFDKVAYDIAFGRSPEYFAVCDIPGKNGQNSYADGAFLFDLDDPYLILEVEKKIFTDQIENEYKKSNGEMTKEMYEEELEAINEHCTEIKEFIDYIKNNDYYYLQTKNEINKRKEQNTNILRQYGLNI